MTQPTLFEDNESPEFKAFQRLVKLQEFCRDTLLDEADNLSPKCKRFIKETGDMLKDAIDNMVKSPEVIKFL